MKISRNEVYRWCEEQFEEQLSLLKTLAAIPAPSHSEEKRAEFIRNWLVSAGAGNVTIDEAKNVIVPFSCDENSPYLLCMAHTDVVFPDTEPLPVREENGRLYAPGVGDDTANVVAMMLCIKFLLTHPGICDRPILFVFDSCEEGLGNLKGVRRIMEDYSGRIAEMVSFDLQSHSIITRAVGSERWEVSVSTTGGHSYSNFGNPNAIAHLSKLILALYQQPLPRKPNSKTTFNVGTVVGGTSVNTIAQNAVMTYEYRSDDLECLTYMRQQFHVLLEEMQEESVVFSAKSIGNRPCGSKICSKSHENLIKRCADAISSVYPVEPALCSGSTDANIPLSQRIPAATFGLYRGAGAHTRQEYVETDSLTPGLKIALNFLLSENISD